MKRCNVQYAMSEQRITCIETLLLLLLVFIGIVACDVLQDSVPPISVEPVNDVSTKHREVLQFEAIKEKKNAPPNVDKAKPNESSISSKGGATEKVRMVTKEELALYDGKQKPSVWLSILGKVFDVSAGPEYYAEKGPYRVFVAREGNVPFVTGIFTPEEAAKPLSSLQPHDLSNLEHWQKFYLDEEKYPYIGLLEGDLYDKDGNPTEEMKVIQDKIATVKVKVEERKKKTANIIARRKKEDDDRKKEMEKRKKRERFEELKKQKLQDEKSIFSALWKFFQGKTTVDQEL